MYEYKVIKSEFHWSNNMNKFENLLNEYAQKGWNVTGFSVVGDQANNFVALLQRPKQ